MNLRDNYLPLSGAIREENLEALFNVKEVSTKYRQIVQSEEFHQELCEQHNALVKLVDELSQEVGRDSRYDQIASKEDLMELVRTNVILNAIGNVLDSIIFDGVPVEKAVAEFITVEFAIQILYGVINAIWEECKEIATENMIIDAIYSDPDGLYS